MTEAQTLYKAANNWTNQETYKTYYALCQNFFFKKSDLDFRSLKEQLEKNAEYIKQHCIEILNSQTSATERGFVWHTVNNFFDKVNWKEIAEHVTEK